MNGSPAADGPKAAAPDRDAAARYEILRHRVLDASPQPGGGLGWGVFITQGMAAWLKAGSHPVSPRDLEPLAAEPPGGHPCVRTPSEIVAVVTGMVWSRWAHIRGEAR